ARNSSILPITRISRYRPRARPAVLLRRSRGRLSSRRPAPSARSSSPQKSYFEAVEDGYKRGLKPATTYCDNVSAKHVVAGFSPRSHRRNIATFDSDFRLNESSTCGRIGQQHNIRVLFLRPKEEMIAAPLPL